MNNVIEIEHISYFLISLSIDLDILSKVFFLEKAANSITLLLKNEAKTICLQINQTNENTTSD